MTPYGQSGPQSELTGFDFTAFYALGGVMGLMGDPNDKLMRAGNESYRTGARDRFFLAGLLRFPILLPLCVQGWVTCRRRWRSPRPSSPGCT